MIHIYSGTGKGKTSAAGGLAVRAAGAGMKVTFCQFLKDGNSSEIAVLAAVDGISVRCCKECSKFTFEMNEAEKRAVIREHDLMLAQARELIENGRTDVLILDEFLDAYNMEFFDRSAAEELVRNCPDSVELVLTGRDPAAVFREAADYHSEIMSVRHPYDRGVQARKGIEF